MTGKLPSHLPNQSSLPPAERESAKDPHACRDWQEGSNHILVCPRTHHVRWQVDRYISRSQRTPALRGSETSQQDVKARGDTVSDPGAILGWAAPEVWSCFLHLRVGTMGHPQA